MPETTKSLRDFLEELNDALLHRYYLNVKQKVLGAEVGIHPFNDTVEYICTRKDVRTRLIGPGLLDDDYLRKIIRRHLLQAIEGD